MIFFKTLKNSIGGLLRLKTQLWWYNGRRWDGSPGCVCLILDAYDGLHANAAAQALHGRDERVGITATVLLLIDESPTWVWVDERNTELITSKPTL